MKVFKIAILSTVFSASCGKLSKNDSRLLDKDVDATKNGQVKCQVKDKKANVALQWTLGKNNFYDLNIGMIDDKGNLTPVAEKATVAFKTPKDKLVLNIEKTKPTLEDKKLPSMVYANSTVKFKDPSLTESYLIVDIQQDGSGKLETSRQKTRGIAAIVEYKVKVELTDCKIEALKSGPIDLEEDAPQILKKFAEAMGVFNGIQEIVSGKLFVYHSYSDDAVKEIHLAKKNLSCRMVNRSELSTKIETLFSGTDLGKKVIAAAGKEFSEYFSPDKNVEVCIKKEWDKEAETAYCHYYLLAPTAKLLKAVYQFTTEEFTENTKKEFDKLKCSHI